MSCNMFLGHAGQQVGSKRIRQERGAPIRNTQRPASLTGLSEQPLTGSTGMLGRRVRPTCARVPSPVSSEALAPTHDGLSHAPTVLTRDTRSGSIDENQAKG